MTKTLIFTVAVNGYHFQYQSNLKALEQYACRVGFNSVVVTEPKFTSIGMEVVWLKVSLILAALKAGYEWVMFVDADAEIKPGAPNILETIDVRNAFFAAKGFSGRINSGVMLFRRCDESIQFLEKVLSHKEKPIPIEDDVGWGENGHIIHFSHQFPLVEIIDQRWNNNTDPALDDYIRHYSAGPMRPLFKAGKINSLQFTFCHYWLAIYSRLSRLLKGEQLTLSHELDLLTANTLLKYPVLQNN